MIETAQTCPAPLSVRVREEEKLDKLSGNKSPGMANAISVLVANKRCQ